jgi:hypothetical protein
MINILTFFLSTDSQVGALARAAQRYPSVAEGRRHSGESVLGQHIYELIYLFAILVNTIGMQSASEAPLQAVR